MLLQVCVPYSTRGAIQYLYYSALGLPRCREVGFIQRLYIISTDVRLGLPDGLVLGLQRCREVGFIQWLSIISTDVRSGLPDGLLVCHGVVRLVSSNKLYIISTAVRSGLPNGLLHWVATVS